MTLGVANVEAFILVSDEHIVWPLAAAKDRAASAKNVRRKARAVERITQGQGAQHGTDCLMVMGEGALENAVAEIGEDIFTLLFCIDDPAFNPDTEITSEKVFKINTTTPGMVGLEVAVILPLVSCKNIGTPDTDVEFVIGVPFRTRRWPCHLLHLLAAIGFGTSKA